MKCYKKIFKYIKKPLLIIVFLNNKGLHIINDKLYLKILFRINFNKGLDLKNPRTFNEKLQWLKLYDRKDIYTTMVDKSRVKEYVAKTIGEEYIIPTIKVYDSFNKIDFNELPNKFVIKCTHDSGGVIVCKNLKKFDKKTAKKILNKSMKKNFYYFGREWPYKNVKPKIIIERYMEDNQTNELRDYKFFCFNGQAKFFKIDFDRFTNHRANYYDNSGKLLHFGEIICPPDYNKDIKMPKNLDKMIELANMLSKNIPFLRVDFYEVNNKIYFGELTFYPASGFGKFTDGKVDAKLGKMIDLKGVNDEDNNCK